MPVVASKRLRLAAYLSGGLLLTSVLCLVGPRLSGADNAEEQLLML